jgi:hypothetical protein
MTKQCDELRDLLAGYRDGELSPREQHLVADHLASCADCALAFARDEEIETIVAESVVPRSSGHWEALATRIEDALERARERAPLAEERSGRWERLVHALTPRRVAFGSIGTLLVAALVFLLQPWESELSPESETPPATVRSEAPPPEKLRALGYLDDSPAAPAERAVDRASPAAPSGASPEEQEEAPRAEEPAVPPPLPDAGRAAAPTPEPTPPAGRTVREVGLPATGVFRAPAGMKANELVAGPSFAPSPPRGARSIEEVRAWLGPDVTDAESAVLLLRALDRANALISQGERGAGREGLVLLTGDFEGNIVRDEAWAALLDLDADAALAAREPEVILPIALSIDAFLEAYPNHEDAAPIREQQVRVWARLATIDPEHCAAALARARAWEQSLGGPAPPGIGRVVAELRSGPCGE